MNEVLGRELSAISRQLSVPSESLVSIQSSVDRRSGSGIIWPNPSASLCRKSDTSRAKNARENGAPTIFTFGGHCGPGVFKEMSLGRERTTMRLG